MTGTEGYAKGVQTQTGKEPNISWPSARNSQARRPRYVEENPRSSSVPIIPGCFFILHFQFLIDGCPSVVKKFPPN
jgi:hypothetical protein